MAFSFENFERNENLRLKGIQPPRTLKTGTTICAIKFKDGVVLGADTRATNGEIIATKECEKIHYLTDFMRCCGAGTAADCDKVTKMASSQLELHRLLIGKEKVPIDAAIRIIKQYLFQYQGYIGASLIVAGVDDKGGRVESLSPHGSSQAMEYIAQGSGCLVAIAELEKGWKPNMELEDAKKLVRDAIAAGVYQDLGSGNNIDLCVITKDGSQNFRHYEIGPQRIPREKSYRFKPKSTTIISRTVIPIKIENTTVRQMDVEPMEVL